MQGPSTLRVSPSVTGSTFPAGAEAEPGRLSVRQAGLHAAAAGPGGAQLRLLRLHGLPATPRRLMPALWRHLCHRSLCVLQGVSPVVTKNPALQSCTGVPQLLWLSGYAPR